MPKFHLSVDSPADLSEEMLRFYGVTTLPFSVKCGSISLTDKVPTEEEFSSLFTDCNGFENGATASVIPEKIKISGKKTAKNDAFCGKKCNFCQKEVKIPTKSDYENYFDELNEQHENTVHLSIGSSLSLAYSRAFSAAKNTMVKFYGHNVFTVDGGSFSAGLALLSDYAVGLCNKGATAEEAFVELSSIVPKIEQYVITDDLSVYNKKFPSASGEWAQKSGAFAILTVNDAGKLVIYKKFASFGSAVKAIFSEKNPDNLPSTAYVYGGADLSKQLKTVAFLRKNGVNDIKMSAMSLSNCALFGKNAVSVAFLGERVKSVKKKQLSPVKSTDFFTPADE